MVYLWRNSDDLPEELIGEYVRSNSVDRFELKKGVAIAADSKIVLRFACPKASLAAIDDLPNSAMIPVVSPRVADVLRSSAASECQLIEAHIIASDGALGGYSAVVATKSLAVMDRLQSEYTTVPGTDAVMAIQRLVCRDTGLHLLSMARDTEYLSNLFVSDELRLAILGVRPRGIAFYEPSRLNN